jgi:hypothetical protein
MPYTEDPIDLGIQPTKKGLEHPYYSTVGPVTITRKTPGATPLLDLILLFTPPQPART